MAPRTSWLAKETCTVVADELAHVPSVVPRTVTAMGSPPRFARDMKAQVCGSMMSSQPPEGADGCAVSTVCVEQLVMTRVSVIEFEKSTSKDLNAVPNGVH